MFSFGFQQKDHSERHKMKEQGKLHKEARHLHKNPTWLEPTEACPKTLCQQKDSPKLQIQRGWIPHDVGDGEIHMHQSSAISRIQEGMYLRVASENGNPIEQLEVSLLSETQMLTFQTSIYYTI